MIHLIETKIKDNKFYGKVEAFGYCNLIGPFKTEKQLNKYINERNEMFFSLNEENTKKTQKINSNELKSKSNINLLEKKKNSSERIKNVKMDRINYDITKADWYKHYIIIKSYLEIEDEEQRDRFIYTYFKEFIDTYHTSYNQLMQRFKKENIKISYKSLKIKFKNNI